MTKRAQQARDYAIERLEDILQPSHRHWGVAAWFLAGPMKHDPEVLRVADEQTMPKYLRDVWERLVLRRGYRDDFKYPIQMPPRDG